MNISKRGREPDERIQRGPVRKVGVCKHQLSSEFARKSVPLFINSVLTTLRRANDNIFELER